MSEPQVKPWYFSVSTATKAERQVLLITNGTNKGGTFFAHCIDALIGHFKGVKKLCFIAFGDNDMTAYTNKVRGIFAPYGIQVEGIHEPGLEDNSQNARDTLLKAEAVLVGDGNTFQLQKGLQHLHRLMGARVWAGMPFAAVGAGAVVAGISIQTTTDMPVVLPPHVRGQQLVPFNLHVMYHDPNPNEQTSRLTVADQIRNYHEGSVTPVLALREGTFIRVQGDSCTLGGSSAGGRLFLRNTDAIEYAKGADLGFLILQNLNNNLEFKVTVEDKAQEAATTLERNLILTKRKAMATPAGQRMSKSLDEGAGAVAAGAKSFAGWSSNMFTKLKNDMSGASSYPPDDEEEELASKK